MLWPCRQTYGTFENRQADQIRWMYDTLTKRASLRTRRPNTCSAQRRTGSEQDKSVRLQPGPARIAQRKYAFHLVSPGTDTVLLGHWPSFKQGQRSALMVLPCRNDRLATVTANVLAPNALLASWSMALCMHALSRRAGGISAMLEGSDEASG
jgi:hypothetical protein